MAKPIENLTTPEQAAIRSYIGVSPLNIAHADLVTARAGSNLVPGRWYRITDYRTKYARFRWTGAGTAWDTEVATAAVEPLLVMALAANKLCMEAFSEAFPQDVIVYDVTDSSVTGTAGTQSRTGYIQRRTDTKRNISLPYDYRTMKWNRYRADTAAFPAYSANTVYAPDALFSSGGDFYIATGAVVVYSTASTNVGPDAGIEIGDIVGGEGIAEGTVVTSFVDGVITLSAALTGSPTGQWTFTKPALATARLLVGAADTTYLVGREGQNIQLYADSGVVDGAILQPLGSAVEFFTFSSTLQSAPSEWSASVSNFIQSGLSSVVYNNVIYAANCKDITIGTGFTSNTIRDNFTNNAIGNSFYGNTIGSGFSSNIIGHDFYLNTIGNTFNGNTIGRSCGNNTIWNSFTANTIGNSFYGNTIGSGFSSNIIGHDFYLNTIWNSFTANTIGNSFYGNTIGSGFLGNIALAGFNGSTIGDSFRYNTIISNDFGGGVLSSVNFAGASHVYNAYPTTIAANEVGTLKLSYLNTSNVLTYVAPTS